VEPLRILVATDAAREGINLQAHCADLFHMDLPWNPGRLEQRNGRIDRALQPEPEVRCHYFVYPARREDRVLETLVRKIDTVQRELGSLGGVLLEEMEQALANGIRDGTADQLEGIGKGRSTRTVEDELEEWLPSIGEATPPTTPALLLTRRKRPSLRPTRRCS
jgi:superfamily II DNA/RNA helicase